MVKSVILHLPLLLLYILILVQRGGAVLTKVTLHLTNSWFVMLNLFGLIPQGGASVGDVRDGNAADRVVGHSAHEQQLVTAPGQKMQVLY